MPKDFTTYAEYNLRFNDTDHWSSPSGCHDDCPKCNLTDDLDLDRLLHNDQPPTCPHCGSRMQELDPDRFDREGVHRCNDESCDYICIFENDEEFDEQNDHECCDQCMICLGLDPKLSAAAPELLEALCAVLKLADAGVIQRNETGKPSWSILDELKTLTRAAIAKATSK